MNSLIKDFVENANKYNQSCVAEFAMHCLERSETQFRYKIKGKAKDELNKLIVYPRPFDKFIEHSSEFTVEELNILIDNMESGWARAKLMDVLERKSK